ncbi:MAG: peptidase [Bryobacterales bacterium]|nr:peptidase [Bryobacterales bacterium]
MTKTLPLLLLAGALVAAAPNNISELYREPSQKLIHAALADEEGLQRLQYLCDRIGNRVSGSASLERAIVWAAAEMKKAGLENVQTPPVKVPKWVRGRESALMLEPVQKPLTMIGLGMSIGTPNEGITGSVVTVKSFDELNALGRDKVAGRIVLFNPAWEGYGQTVMYRTGGASAAAKLGAVAVLVRSMTGVSLQTPHTGAMNYEDGVAKIPAAAVSVEDAAMIERIVKSGTPVQVRLTMEAHQEPDADSHNVIGEIRGREKPEEVVVLGGHIDSWDIGQGANDDGSGIMATFQAVALIKKLGLQPRRTIRVVFWVNEENGGAGGKAYRAMVGDAIKNHVAAIEMDGGAEKPVGFGFGGGGEFGAGGGGGRRRRVAPGGVAPSGLAPGAAPAKTSPASFQRAVDIGKLLAGIEGGNMTPGGGGSDIAPLLADGVPGFGVRTVGTHYFDWHHTNADSFDKIVPREFQLNVASLAVLSYVLADMPERLADLK